MARIRTVKPEFFLDRKLAKGLTRDQRLFFVGLWNQADDDGRFVDSPKTLHGNIFPHDDDIDESFTEDSLRALAALNRIVRYEIDGERYGWIVNFRRHQVINRPSASRIPPCPSHLLPTHGALTETSLRAHIGNREVEGEREVEREVEVRAPDDVFGSLEDLTIAAIKGLYGWDDRKGTDERVWANANGIDRRACIQIAVQRLEGEGRSYNGRLFRRILETVIEEQQKRAVTGKSGALHRPKLSDRKDPWEEQ